MYATHAILRSWDSTHTGLIKNCIMNKIKKMIGITPIIFFSVLKLIVMKKIEIVIVMRAEDKDDLEIDVQKLIKACHVISSVKEMDVILFNDKGKPEERIHALRVVDHPDYIDSGIDPINKES
jgi:hypothetical protein